MPGRRKLVARHKRHQRIMARHFRKGRKRQSIHCHGAKQRAAKTARKLAGIRFDWAQQASRQIVNDNDVAVTEDLRSRSMAACAKGSMEKPGSNVACKRGLNRSIPESSRGRLANLLKYKTNMVRTDGAYTNQTCRECGPVNREQRRTQAGFHCGECGFVDNADVNAAPNILERGIARLSREAAPLAGLRTGQSCREC